MPNFIYKAPFEVIITKSFNKQHKKIISRYFKTLEDSFVLETITRS